MQEGWAGKSWACKLVSLGRPEGAKAPLRLLQGPLSQRPLGPW